MYFRILIILTILFITPREGFSQIGKGDKFVGISALPVYWFNEGKFKSYGFISRLYLGKQISNKITLGFQPYYVNLFGTKTTGVNVYSRYYLFTNRASLFVEGSTGLGAISSYNSSSFDHSLVSYTIGSGFSYFLKKSISVEFILQYQHWSLISDQDYGQSFVPSIGLNFYLNK